MGFNFDSTLGDKGGIRRRMLDLTDEFCFSFFNSQGPAGSVGPVGAVGPRGPSVCT
jgi:hypothetical protein